MQYHDAEGALHKVTYPWNGVQFDIDTLPSTEGYFDGSSDESTELKDGDKNHHAKAKKDKDALNDSDDEDDDKSDSNEDDDNNEDSSDDESEQQSDADSSEKDDTQQIYLYDKPRKEATISKPGSLSYAWKHGDEIKKNEAVDEDDDEYIVLPIGSDDSDDEATEAITELPKMLEQTKINDKDKKNKTKKKKKKGDYDMTDSYIDYKVNRHGVLNHKPSETLIQTRKDAVHKLLKEKSIAHKPGLEKLESVPNENMSDRKKKKIRKEERSKSKGKDWFNLPATEVTEEVKRDLEILQMRSVLDPKTFYKKNDLKVLPKFFQIGTVQDNAADFYHSRIPKKDRKRTLVDELLADAQFQKRSKQKFKEIVQEKKRTESRAHRHARKLKRKK